jgi:hypothetical protein
VTSRHRLIFSGLLCASVPSLGASACGADEPLILQVGETPGAASSDDVSPSSPFQAEVAELYQAIIDATAGHAAFMCECEIAGTTETLEECVWRTSRPIAPPIARCTQEILGTSADSLRALTCAAAARTSFLECIRQSTCLDFAHQLDCQIEYVKVSDCPSIPWDVWVRNQVECIGDLPPEEHVCADGTKINAAWVCDGEADCPDASDEHLCHP